MKKSRYTEVQVTYASGSRRRGRPVADVCRQTGIAEATFCLWQKKYGSLGVPEVRELRQMREENARLKRLVADLTLENRSPGGNPKKAETSSQTGVGPVGVGPLPGEWSKGVRAWPAVLGDESITWLFPTSL
jgi:putative transposase